MPSFCKPSLLTDAPMHYCPGCGHGIMHRLVAEAIEEIGEADNCVGVVPVGCAVFAYRYFDCDIVQAAHGRAQAVASGIRRAQPGRLMFVYQGDGDLASIGMAETIHAAARNENMTVIFVNNGIYGMTGGQMAPTTLLGAKTTTSQGGRTLAQGQPLRICEMLATIDNVQFLARVSIDSPAQVRNARQMLVRALRTQQEGRGYSLVEVLSNCPTNFHMSPQQSLEAVRAATEYYPLGIFKEAK